MRVLNKDAGVPPQLLKAYFRGGRMWPQTRAGMNLTIIAELCRSPDLVADFDTFAHSNFSDSQLLIVRNLLIADHSQAGIYVPPELPDSLFQFEWKRIRGAVAKTFMMYFGIDFAQLRENGREQYQLYLDEKFLCRILAALSDPINEENIYTMKNIAATTYASLVSHQALAAIFRLTFTEPTIAKAMLDENASIVEAVSQYKITASPLRDQLSCRNQCLNIIEQILDYELANSFPGKSMQWITWGFGSFDQHLSSRL